MTEQQESEWQKIEDEIYTSFKDVKLEDGIGYYEAGARDEYLQPGDEKYEIEKGKDERDDWAKLLTDIKNPESDRHCFMDAKGLRFYLPFLMVRRDTALSSVMNFYISEFYKRQGYSTSNFTETVKLLTKEQKQCIYHFYEFLNKIANSGFSEEELDDFTVTGEITMKDFNYMEFMKEQFDVK